MLTGVGGQASEQISKHQQASKQGKRFVVDLDFDIDMIVQAKKQRR